MSAILEDAKRRIQMIRRRDVEFLILKDGNPLPNVPVTVRMKNHQFLFGAVCYKYGTYPLREENELFTREFTRLFNYTMIPFHWSWYEPEQGHYNEPYTGNLLRWAVKNNLKRKLHALIWHELCPDWIHEGDDVKSLMTRRIEYLMSRYGDDFDFFDVANETTVNDRFHNPVAHWIREYGPINMLRFGVELTRSFKPDAKLIYGDWNVHGEEYYDFLRQIRESGIDIDLLGIQSHQHVDRWTEEETMRILERASEFGWPIHFPECSVCSGTPVGVTKYGAGEENHWHETQEDLYSQAEFTRDFYTLIFSHPAVEALSWFDFTDHRWLNAPAGVVTDTLQPKPVYDVLYDLILRQWHTDADLVTGPQGWCGTNLFFGTYEITVQIEGQPYVFIRTIPRRSFYSGGDGPQRISLRL